MSNSEQMLVALENHDFDLAEHYFHQALQKDDSEVLLSLAEYLESRGFFHQAKQIYLKFHKEFPEFNLNLAQIASDDGQLEEAFLYLDNIGKDSPYYVNSLVIMADLYDSEGLTDVAREKMLEATQLTDNPLVIFGLAEMTLSLGDYKEAIGYYASLDNRAILAETGISTYERIGKAYASLGKFETAISFLEKSIEIAFDEQTIFELATLLVEQEEYQKATLYFKQLETLSPDFEGYHYGYALALKAEHHLKEAYRVAQEGLSKNSFDVALLLLTSQLAYENHDVKNAEDYLLKAKGIADDQEEILLRLSNLYLEQERFEDLVALDEEDIDNILTKWHIGKAYRQLDDVNNALRIYTELETDLRDNPEFLKDYAYLLRELGNREKLAAILEHYSGLVPDDLDLVSLLDDDLA